MKKKLRILGIVLLTLLLTVASFGCYMISSQTMDKVKGTYELTRYTRTNGGDGTVTNYIEDHGYKVYLVVTGTSEGYYVFSSTATPAYRREVILSYEYDQDNSSKIDRVAYKFGIYEEEESFGVTNGALNFSRPPIKFSDKIYSDGINMTWKKVSGATDLSYVTAQLGEVPPYENP